MTGKVEGLRRLKDGTLSLMLSFPKGTSMAALEALGDSVGVHAPEVDTQATPVSMEALRGIIASATAMLDTLIANAQASIEEGAVLVHEEKQPDIFDHTDNGA